MRAPTTTDLKSMSYSEARQLYLALQWVAGSWEFYAHRNFWVHYTASGEFAGQVYQRDDGDWTAYISLYKPRTPTEGNKMEWEEFREIVKTRNEAMALVDEKLRETRYIIPGIEPLPPSTPYPTRVDLLMEDEE